MISNPPFPTYARSNHPKVIEAIRETDRRNAEFKAKCREVSLKYTSDPQAKCYISGWYYIKRSFAGISARAIEDISALPGRWKAPRRGMIAPYANNPASKDFNISYEAASIPGRGNLFMGSGYMGTGIVFEHGGYVYSHLGFSTDSLSDREFAEMNKFGWHEILGSEFHLAVEAAKESDLAAASNG